MNRPHPHAQLRLIARRDVLLGATGAAGAGALALGGCGVFETRASYRFRMTIEADTPAGARSGSPVLQVNADKGVKLLPEHMAAGRGLPERR